MRGVENRPSDVGAKPGLTRTSLLYVDNHFICLGEDGLLRLVQASEHAYVEVALAEVREKANDPPLIQPPAWLRRSFPTACSTFAEMTG